MNPVGSAVPEAAAAVAAYHQILADAPDLAAATASMLAEEQPRSRLMFGPEPLCRVLRPHFLTPQSYATIRQVCGVLSRAMFRVAERMATDAELRRPLHLTPAEEDLVAIDPGYREVSPTTRLDSFMTGDSWRFVEYNAETPAAIAYEDHLTALFLRLPAMQSFMERYRVTPLPAQHHLLEALLDAGRQWGARPIESVAIVDWAGLPTAAEHELVAEYLRAAGLRATIAQPGELTYDGERLRVRGEPIDLVYRRVLTSELLQDPEVARPLISAYRAHDVCVVNSFRAKLLHKKAIFAVLSDERYGHLFTAEERALIDMHVPWTREVAEGFTTHAGRRIDLVRFICEDREKLVLKPNDEYGGKGVVIGWERSQPQWEAAVEEALTVPFVVQERVPVDRVPFPMWEAGTLTLRDLTPDLDPFLFGTEVKGLLTRLSAASLLNVTAGTGSVAPTVLVEPL